jgi:uridine phosphorylase
MKKGTVAEVKQAVEYKREEKDLEDAEMENLHGIDLETATLKTFINKSGNRVMIIYPEENVLQEEFKKDYRFADIHNARRYREVAAQTLE